MGAHHVFAAGLQADAAEAGALFLFFPEEAAAVEGKLGIEGEFFEPPGVVGRIVAFQGARKTVIGRSGGFWVFQVPGERGEDIVGKNTLVEERFHQPGKSAFPFIAVGQRAAFPAQGEFLLRPGKLQVNMVVGQFMHQGHQESIGIEISVNGDPGRAVAVSGAVIARFGGSFTCYGEAYGVAGNKVHHLLQRTFGQPGTQYRPDLFGQGPFTRFRRRMILPGRRGRSWLRGFQRRGFRREQGEL